MTREHSAAAVPETVGGAAVVRGDKSPSLVAEAIREVCGNQVLRDDLARARVARLSHFSADAVGTACGVSLPASPRESWVAHQRVRAGERRPGTRLVVDG